MSGGWRLRRGLGSTLATLLAAGAAWAADGSLSYVVDADGETIVFTNVPTPRARPVPGLSAAAAPEAPPRGAAALPATIYDRHIEQVAAEFDLSPQLIKAVALVESGFDPHAESHAGAQGLMQLMPATAEAYGVTDAFDPLANLRAGTEHLRGLLDEFDGDLTLALAAYNAGAGAVRRHKGVPDYRETVDYVRKVHEKLGKRPGPLGPRAPAARPLRSKVMADGSLHISN